MGNRHDSQAFYQLFTDLATGTLEHVADPLRCAEHVAEQVRELLGVKAVAVLGCMGHVLPHVVLAVRPRRHLDLIRRPEMDRLVHLSHGFAQAMTIGPDDASPVGTLLRAMNLGASILVPLRVGRRHIGALALLGLMDMHGIETIVRGLNRLAPLLALIMRQADQFRDLEVAVRERTAELRAARDRLEEQHAFLSALLASLPSPVCVEDAQGRILRCNQAYETLFGSERTLIGTVGPCVVLPDQLPARTSGADDEPRSDECECRLLDGTVRRMLLARAPFRDRQGLVAGFINVLTDVTDLAEARGAAEASSRAKSEFLANMSHEIRTPLNGVLGMLQLLERTVLDEEQQDLVRTATRSSRRLTQLLSDILDLSRIEAGKLVLERAAFRFADLRDAVLDLFATTAADKGLVLDFHIDEAIPDVVIGDEGRLRQILFNLVGNAIKFTAHGEIRVSASLDSGADTVVRLRVADTGVGIPRERHEDIFQAFTQVDGSAVRAFGGVGLGLAIVKRLVDMMRGRIEVESEPGQGTTMTAVVPLAPGLSVQPDPAPRERSVPRTRRVLVVEDDQVNQMALIKMLQKLGHIPVLARNGREALETLGHGRFDCVLMDIQMPVMDGVAATLAIRSGSVPGAPPDIPIIALTGHAMSGDRERFLDAGMTDYLSKPVDMDALARIIDRVTG